MSTAMDVSFDREPEVSDKRSVLGPTLVFKGELTAGEDLMIRGRVEGRIEHNARQLTIGREGVVNADVKARSIRVEGTVEGNMYASESIVICDSGHVRGNLYAPRVAIVEGAKFKGSIDMDVKTGKDGKLDDAQIDKLLAGGKAG